MSALTKRVVIFAVGLSVLGAVSANAMPPHAVVVAPAVIVQRPFFYDPFWGPWGPYTYGYPHAYSLYPQASIRTKVTPKDVYVEGFRTVSYDVYARLDSTLKLDENMQPLASRQASAPVPAPNQG